MDTMEENQPVYSTRPHSSTEDIEVHLGFWIATSPVGAEHRAHAPPFTGLPVRVIALSLRGFFEVWGEVCREGRCKW